MRLHSGNQLAAVQIGVILPLFTRAENIHDDGYVRRFGARQVVIEEVLHAVKRVRLHNGVKRPLAALAGDGDGR